MSSLAVLWLLGSLFSGGDGDCRVAEEQGERTMRQIGKQWPLRSVEDPVSEYVQRIGVRLARVTDPQLRNPWDFYVLRNAEPSAIAVGGRHFVISDGLIAFVRNESELVAVLAHEISHQTLGHFCRGSTPAVELIDRGTVVQHYDLEAEMDADRDAVRLLAATGFDPGAMESVLRCLRRSPGTTERHLMTRIQALARRRTPSENRGKSQSAAFGAARSSVMEDLGGLARQGCR
jgi:beta-barrel assembly-enhancing protease